MKEFNDCYINRVHPYEKDCTCGSLIVHSGQTCYQDKTVFEVLDECLPGQQAVNDHSFCLLKSQMTKIMKYGDFCIDGAIKPGCSNPSKYDLKNCQCSAEMTCDMSTQRCLNNSCLDYCTEMKTKLQKPCVCGNGLCLVGEFCTSAQTSQSTGAVCADSADFISSNTTLPACILMKVTDTSCTCNGQFTLEKGSICGVYGKQYGCKAHYEQKNDYKCKEVNAANITAALVCLTLLCIAIYASIIICVFYDRKVYLGKRDCQKCGNTKKQRDLAKVSGKTE